MGIKSATTGATRLTPLGAMAVVVWFCFGIGIVVEGAQVAERALRAGTTVSTPVVAALIAYLVVGAMVGGLFLMAMAVARRVPIDRASGRRSASVVNPAFDRIAPAVLIGGWSFFQALDQALIAPGETPALSVAARLYAAAFGCVVVVGVVTSALQSRRYRSAGGLPVR